MERELQASVLEPDVGLEEKEPSPVQASRGWLVPMPHLQGAGLGGLPSYQPCPLEKRPGPWRRVE